MFPATAQVSTNSTVVPDVSPGLPVVEPPLPASEGTPAPPTTSALTAPAAAPVPMDGSGSAPPPAEAVVPTVSGNTRRFRYAFRLALSTVYDDNVSLRGSSSGSDVYFTIEPGVTAGFGDIVGRQSNYVRIDYAPSFYLHASASEANALQHLIRLEGQYVFTRLTTTLSQDVQLLDGSDLNVSTNTGTVVNRVNLDVSARTRVNIYVSRALLNYMLSDKSALALALLYNNNDYRTLISSQTVSADFSYNYIYSPKLSLGAAVSTGYLSVKRGTPNQVFEQFNLRASYQSTGKLAVNGSVGLEARQFEGSSGNHVTPVLELGLLYQPFDGTTISLSANRRVLSSATLAGQDYTTTGFVGTGRQRFFQRYFLSLTLGYENASYFSASGQADSSREDSYYYVQPSLEFRITETWNVNLFYVHRQNASSSGNTSFANNQFGLRTSYNF